MRKLSSVRVDFAKNSIENLSIKLLDTKSLRFLLLYICNKKRDNFKIKRKVFK